MIIGILQEPSFESRVSLLAGEAASLINSGIDIWVEKDAGLKAFCLDEDYRQSGANIKTRAEIFDQADILLGIHYNDIPFSLTNKVFIGVYQPLYSPGQVEEWAQKENTVFSLDMLPRTTRAQTMDVLSSQSNIAGYKAALLAAASYSRYFPMMMTAAGSVPPARVLILGAGVAGLQAVATSRRLGAVVEVFDTRLAAKEEVLSLGAKFVEVEGAADDTKAGGYAVDQTADYQEKQKLKIAESIKKADIVITTAQVFGKKAPVLVTKDMIRAMRPGSIIVDLAASTGGNTELTQDRQTILWNNITIVGDSNLASSMPSDASKAYGRNVLSFLKMLINKDGALEINLSDDIINNACITTNGQIISPIIKNRIHANAAQLHSSQS
ncbi:MAG TPA: NAD(P) transhydrogenase subunit alpha [Mucilaginibacter sp.]|jgi:NAD(P) transhydrogenase subunit alpha|nr:NAD(P) transhydrogenase subunit alpha [Mucilaginibacter sp.]